MPFDPFFSSTNKKHFVENKSATALYQSIKAMDRDGRMKEMSRWKTEPNTPERHIVRKMIGFDLIHRRRAAIKRKNQKNIKKAIEDYHKGKRDKIEIYQGYNTCSGAVGKIQQRAHKSR